VTDGAENYIMLPLWLHQAFTRRVHAGAGIVNAIAEALGNEPKVVHYNPKDFDKAFPFRSVPAAHAVQNCSLCGGLVMAL